MLELPVPPSVNHLYIKTRGGGIALSAAANKYRESVKKIISSQITDVSTFDAGDDSTIYMVSMWCYLNNLENPGWYERYAKDAYYTKDSKDKKHKKGDLKHGKGERKAKSRYKKIDIDNRVKFAQDCVIKGLGILDDSQVFEGSQKKLQDPGPERLVVQVVTRPRGFYFIEGGDVAEEAG